MGETTWNNPAPCKSTSFSYPCHWKNNDFILFQGDVWLLSHNEVPQVAPAPNPISNLQIPHVNLHLALRAWQLEISVSQMEPPCFGADGTIKIYLRKKRKRTEYRTHIRWTKWWFYAKFMAWENRMFCVPNENCGNSRVEWKIVLPLRQKYVSQS